MYDDPIDPIESFSLDETTRRNVSIVFNSNRQSTREDRTVSLQDHTCCQVTAVRMLLIDTIDFLTITINRVNTIIRIEIMQYAHNVEST
jgi:hypothetical protein